MHHEFESKYVERSKYDPLPPSGDKYWENSEVHIVKMPEHERCEHDFVHRTSSEVICKICNAGFVLGMGLSVKNGKICTDDNKVLI